MSFTLVQKKRRPLNRCSAKSSFINLNSVFSVFFVVEANIEIITCTVLVSLTPGRYHLKTSQNLGRGEVKKLVGHLHLTISQGDIVPRLTVNFNQPGPFKTSPVTNSPLPGVSKHIAHMTEQVGFSVNECAAFARRDRGENSQRPPPPSTEGRPRAQLAC